VTSRLALESEKFLIHLVNRDIPPGLSDQGTKLPTLFNLELRLIIRGIVIPPPPGRLRGLLYNEMYESDLEHF
jgi:hypothetical protein